jgi:hypothetical protein
MLVVHLEGRKEEAGIWKAVGVRDEEAGDEWGDGRGRKREGWEISEAREHFDHPRS